MPDTPTGGPVAPLAHMVYDDGGRCVGTAPSGGLLLLDQFASAALGPLLESRLGALPPDRIATMAYEVAAAMIAERRRLLEPTVQ